MNIPTLVTPKASLRSCILVATLGCTSFGGSLPAFAAPNEAAVAKGCLADLQAFDKILQKDGYWVGGPGYGYGVPVFGYGYAYGGRYSDFSGYARGRPGYEVHTLVAAAHILAQNDAQTACEVVLTSARTSYATYLTEVHKGQLPPPDVVGWRRQQIETAVPVADDNVAYRSDQLIGASIVNVQDESLGSVDDIVMNPQTGKIAYLVVSHGGFLGIDDSYTPVPWADFKSTSGTNLLILTATKATLEAAPQVHGNQVDRGTEFASRSQQIDKYWSGHMPVAMN